LTRLSLTPYLGGKQFLVDRLIPMMPKHKVYVEVFGGAASLLLNKEPSEVEVYNDADGDLVNLLMQIRDEPERLVKLADSLPYSRQLYESWCKEFVRGIKPADKVEAAARYYLVLRSCFAGKLGGGWRYQRQRAEPETFHNSVKNLPAIAERLRNVLIDCLDYRRCIANWDGEGSFFFLDPPYYNCKKQDYRHVFSPADHEELANLLGGLKGKWLLTYGDHPKIREFYKAYHFVVEETRMQSQGITRFTSDEVIEEGRPQLPHLIITNYDPATCQRFSGTSQDLQRFMAMIVDQAWTMKRWRRR